MRIYINKTHRGGSVAVSKTHRGTSVHHSKTTRLGGALLLSKDLGNSTGGALLLSKKLGGFGVDNKNPIVENTQALTNKLQKLNVRNSSKKNIRFQV